ncbi:protein of unknown function [Moritella yayanosii]|uniref:Uncharacterized protein n=1 Tax=Moritella yayanosii TaxID=69539 RepID=A0A330LKZ2_9GAMM|nr:protein of unknown function [Moritella yayanosii]
MSKYTNLIGKNLHTNAKGKTMGPPVLNTARGLSFTRTYSA